MFGLLSAGGIVAYLKHCEADSDVLMWHFKFMIDDRRAFVRGFSVFVLVFLHRLAAKAGTEVRCRVVGEALTMIKPGYLVEGLMLLGICFLLSAAGLLFQ